MKKFFVSAVTLIHILLINLSMIMIVAMLLLVFANVVLRYVFNSGIFWSEEIALVLEVWFIFLSLGLGVKHRLHFSINLMPREKISAWLNRALDLLSDIVFIVIGAVMILYGSRLVQFTMRSIMPATKLRPAFCTSSSLSRALSSLSRLSFTFSGLPCSTKRSTRTFPARVEH